VLELPPFVGAPPVLLLRSSKTFGLLELLPYGQSFLTEHRTTLPAVVHRTGANY